MQNTVLLLPTVCTLVELGISLSNDLIGAAKNLVASKGLYLNNVPVTSSLSKVEESNLIDGRLAIIRAGKDKLLVLVVGQS